MLVLQGSRRIPARCLHGDAGANTDDAGDNTDDPGAMIRDGPWYDPWMSERDKWKRKETVTYRVHVGERTQRLNRSFDRPRVHCMCGFMPPPPILASCIQVFFPIRRPPPPPPNRRSSAMTKIIHAGLGTFRLSCYCYSFNGNSCPRASCTQCQAFFCFVMVSSCSHWFFFFS